VCAEGFLFAFLINSEIIDDEVKFTRQIPSIKATKPGSTLLNILFISIFLFAI
jgi:hypothetical protein